LSWEVDKEVLHQVQLQWEGDKENLQALQPQSAFVLWQRKADKEASDAHLALIVENQMWIKEETQNLEKMQQEYDKRRKDVYGKVKIIASCRDDGRGRVQNFQRCQGPGAKS
jgi:hypothetical protein